MQTFVVRDLELKCGRSDGKVRFSLEEQVDFGGVGLILNAQIHRNTQNWTPSKMYGKILLQKGA